MERETELKLGLIVHARSLALIPSFALHLEA
jgi:hypothetical protein